MQQFRPSRFEILPLIVKNLLIINGLLFLATITLPALNLNNYLALHFFTSSYFMPHQLITHMFMHGGWAHIIFNMLALWMFGSVLENIWGPKRFLLFYVLCGLGGAAGHLGVTAFNIHHVNQSVELFLQSPDPNLFYSVMDKRIGEENFSDAFASFMAAYRSNPGDASLLAQAKDYFASLPSLMADTPVVGASGALYGVLLAFAVLFPNTLVYVYFFFPLKAKWFVLLLAAGDLYTGFTGSRDGIAHFAHLGGALIGFLLVKFWNKTRKFDLY